MPAAFSASSIPGEQVSDVTAAKSDKAKWLSSGRSIDYANTIYLTRVPVLCSNDSEPMFGTIVGDTVGADFLLTPCSKQTFGSSTRTTRLIRAVSVTSSAFSASALRDHARPSPPPSTRS